MLTCQNSRFSHAFYTLPALALAIILSLVCPISTPNSPQSTSHTPHYLFNPNYPKPRDFDSFPPNLAQISLCTNCSEQDTALFSTGIWLESNKTCMIKSVSTKPSRTLIQILLLISGQISPNPGPIRYPCKICNKPVKSNQKAIECDKCELWLHTKCMVMDANTYAMLQSSSSLWYCPPCVSKITAEADLAQKNNSNPQTPRNTPGNLDSLTGLSMKLC